MNRMTFKCSEYKEVIHVPFSPFMEMPRMQFHVNNSADMQEYGRTDEIISRHFDEISTVYTFT